MKKIQRHQPEKLKKYIYETILIFNSKNDKLYKKKNLILFLSMNLKKRGSEYFIIDIGKKKKNANDEDFLCVCVLYLQIILECFLFCFCYC